LKEQAQAISLLSVAYLSSARRFSTIAWTCRYRWVIVIGDTSEVATIADNTEDIFGLSPTFERMRYR
jgi:hypothetical protein